MDFRRLMDRKGVRIALIVVAFILAGEIWHRHSSAEPYSGRRDQGKPWRKFGNSELVDLGMHEGRLPLCERTMLVDWVCLVLTIVEMTAVLDESS